MLGEKSNSKIEELIGVEKVPTYPSIHQQIDLIDEVANELDSLASEAYHICGHISDHYILRKVSGSDVNKIDRGINGKLSRLLNKLVDIKSDLSKALGDIAEKIGDKDYKSMESNCLKGLKESKQQFLGEEK